ncbi:MAG: sugar ABC transporter permease [Anaerolineales bacterium]|nr:sugar ABC transporter permease [Anaerolineales bacterium]
MTEKTAAQPALVPNAAIEIPWREKFRRLWRAVWRHRWLYIIVLPSVLFFVIFKYWPLFNAQIAFKDFKPVLGVVGSPWVGLKHLEAFFNSYYFSRLIGNTLFYSIAGLILGMPTAIILAIALYETRFNMIRSIVQTGAYIPHFLSWVIMFGVLLTMLSPSEGLINEIIKATEGKSISFLTSPKYFRWVAIFSNIWKETGWSTILYYAALMGIETALFEAASVDGASRLQRIWHISLPGILPVIMIVTLLRLGHILDAGFNEIFVLYSVPVYSVADIIDTWVYRAGILEFKYSLATAVGMFKGVIGLVLLVVSNQLAKRWARTSLY